MFRSTLLTMESVRLNAIVTALTSRMKLDANTLIFDECSLARLLRYESRAQVDAMNYVLRNETIS